ncbi:hypothetical protein ACFFGH_18655 [Lysobacter korlensis]|uniref:Uncharacterized protein n=1 Tax=Lysobacter korlensis TaxID=553636 RepID=A0ABV6RSA8_9GAMM
MKGFVLWSAVLLSTVAPAMSAPGSDSDPGARIVAPAGVVVAMEPASGDPVRAGATDGIDVEVVPGHYSIAYRCPATSNQRVSRHSVTFAPGRVYRLSCPSSGATVLRISELPGRYISVRAPKVAVAKPSAHAARSGDSDGPESSSRADLPHYLRSLSDPLPLAAAPDVIARALKRASCGETGGDVSAISMFTGLSSRPSTSDELHVSNGVLGDGAHWFALQKKDDASFAYCGIVMSPSGTGSMVSMAGIAAEHQARALEAVASGRFFCKCRSLAKR